jgi:hypothetical protein
MEGKSSRKIWKRLMAGMSVLLVTTAITLTFLAVVPVTAAEELVEVRVSVPEPKEIKEGKTFDVTIDIDEVTDFDSAQFDLSFDSSVVEVKDVTDGSLDGETIAILTWSPMDEDTIRVLLDAEGVEGISGSGYLAKICFKVKSEDEGVLELSNGYLSNNQAVEIPARWVNVTLKVGGAEEDEEGEEDEEDEEEVSEEVTLVSPKITAWKPAEAVVGNAIRESRAFNICVNQIADIGWQINWTEVQTNESVTEAAYTNTSAVIGAWNVSAIATNTTTGLSDMHTWIWRVTLTATATPLPTLTPGVTPSPTRAAGVTPTPKPAATTRPTAKPKSTPTPKPPGFNAIFAIAMLAIAYMLLREK